MIDVAMELEEVFDIDMSDYDVVADFVTSKEYVDFVCHMLKD